MKLETSSGNPKLLIIIPAYNEGSRIGKVVKSVNQLLPNTTILVVNDCSSDDTEEQAKSCGAIVINHPINLGYASSLETGYFFAQKHDFDFVVQMDGDGQHLAEEVPVLISPVLDGKADIAIGSRFIRQSGGYKVNIGRRIGQIYFSIVYYLLSKEKITDPTSGFQCLNKHAIDLFTDGQFPDDFPDTDVLLMAYYAKLKIVEVPVKMLERSGGKSIHSGILKPLYYVMKMSLAIFLVIIKQSKWRKDGF